MKKDLCALCGYEFGEEDLTKDYCPECGEDIKNKADKPANKN